MKIKIVGAGLAGCSCASILAERLSKVDDVRIDVYEKGEVGGLCADKDDDKLFQKYGPHIFHTSNPEVIKFVLKYSKWKSFCNRPIAVTDYGLARLPISIETIKDLKKSKLVERDVIDSKLLFDSVIKDYSYKMWGEIPDEDITKRLKIYDGISGSYFDDVFEGLPEEGFSKMCWNMLEDVKINLIKGSANSKNEGYDYVIWTGPIDEAEGFKYRVRWNGVYFTKTRREFDFFNHRIAPVYNLCSKYFTAVRSTDMGKLLGNDSDYILDETPGSDAKHYPIIEKGFVEKIENWIKEEEKEKRFYCGRLATFRYLDMDDVIENAIEVCDKIVVDMVMPEEKK